MTKEKNLSADEWVRLILALREEGWPDTEILNHLLKLRGYSPEEAAPAPAPLPVSQNGEEMPDLTVETDNLAVPEVHLGEEPDQPGEQKDPDKKIVFDTVAVPEIHIDRILQGQKKK